MNRTSIQFNCITFKFLIISSILVLINACSGIYKLDQAKMAPKEVTILNLSNSKLDVLPEEIAQMNNLRELVLFRNKIQQLPAFIGNLEKLETLSLQSNKLTSLPDETGVLKNLKKLNLRFNKLQQLPEGICSLENLEELDLRNNQLTNLPDHLGNLKKLEYLYLSDNNLQSLPDDMRMLKNLKLLHLGRNSIDTLPSFLGELEDLVELDISGCCGNNNLPETLGNLKRLEVLYVSPYHLVPYNVGRNNSRLKVIVK